MSPAIFQPEVLGLGGLTQRYKGSFYFARIKRRVEIFWGANPY